MTNKISVYCSDDYAGLDFGKYSFYYGYEETVPEDAYERELDEFDWAFVAYIDKKEVMRLSFTQIKSYLDKHSRERLDNFEIDSVLLAGIAVFFDSSIES